jgi:hypothetical protein
MHAVKAGHRAAPEAMLMIAPGRLADHPHLRFRPGHVGMLLMLFFGLPSMIRSL